MTIQRGFTLVELGAVCAVVAIAGAAALIEGSSSDRRQPVQTSAPPGKAAPDAKGQPAGGGADHSASKQMKDATQVRAIDQALIIWGNQNGGDFPLPSKLDAKQTTVLGTSPAKDTTANILSILIYTGGISAELCVSPAEANTSIKACATYQFDHPKAAADPERALWDPAFSADFTGGKTGNVSYAHLRTDAGRLSKWSQTFGTMDAVIGNRGPEIARIDLGADGKRTPKTVLENSITFLIHGGPDAWEGNIAYGDAHVEFLTTLLPDFDPEANKWPTYMHEGKRVLDCLFYDEPDDVTRSNAFLGIFVTSPEVAKGTKPIWD